MHQLSWDSNQRIEALGITGASSKGTDLTCAQNNWGSYTSMGTTGFAYEGMIVSLVGASSAGGFWLVDIVASNGANNTNYLVRELPLDAYRWTANDNQAIYNIPVHVPAGTTIYVRIYSTATTTTLNAAIYGLAAGFGFPGASYLTNFISPTSGATGTQPYIAAALSTSAWVQIGYAPEGLEALMVVPINCGTSAGALNRITIDLGVGNVTVEELVQEGLGMCGYGSTSDGPLRGSGNTLHPVNVNPGELVSFRTFNYGTTNTAFHILGLIR